MKTKKKEDEEMRAEYDFSKGERGKFYRPLDQGYTVHIHHSDGSETVKHFLIADSNLWGQEQLRLLSAERGLNWDDMTEKQHEEFVDTILHEKPDNKNETM